ncbi:hypothetical protein TNCV_1987681 [Trichonephila clavipes]|nr:hypothetical protein TNCV_1987681 [Trichonephila clavipes]
MCALVSRNEITNQRKFRQYGSKTPGVKSIKYEMFKDTGNVKDLVRSSRPGVSEATFQRSSTKSTCEASATSKMANKFCRILH